MAIQVGFPSRTCALCRLPGHTRNTCNIIDPVGYVNCWDNPSVLHVRTKRIEDAGYAPMTMRDYCLSVYGISFDEMKRRQRNNEGIPKQKSGNRKPQGYRRWQEMCASQERLRRERLKQERFRRVRLSQERLWLECLRQERLRQERLRREEFRNSRDPNALAQQGYRSNVVEDDVIVVEDDVIPEDVRQASIDAEMARQQSVNNVFNAQAAEEQENVQAAEEPEVQMMSKKNIQEETEVEVEEETCPICLDTLGNTNLFITECGHKFHANCMISSLRVNGKCPCCRQKVLK